MTIIHNGIKKKCEDGYGKYMVMNGYAKLVAEPKPVPKEETKDGSEGQDS